MAADFIIITGDMIQITINPPTTVFTLLAPIPLQGSSSDVTVNGMAICLDGDELPAMVTPPQSYIEPPYVIPGTGTLKLTLNDDNLTQKVTNNGIDILIKGTPFTAEFEVVVPAMQPAPPGPPIPDPSPKKSGKAQFITLNLRVKAA